MFSLGFAWGWLTQNPTRGVKRLQEHKRERRVPGEDLKRLVRAIENHPNQRAAKALLLMLLIGARRGEVLSATWDQFDLERGIWTKPAYATKQNREEHFPLSDAAIDPLHGLKGDQGTKFLFPGDVAGTPLRVINRVWRKVRRDAGPEGLRIHDLRNTFASYLVSGGISPQIVGRSLGHTQAATTQRYAHLADDPLRDASDRFGQRISSDLKKKSGRFKPRVDRSVSESSTPGSSSAARSSRNHIP
jgi:integrase